MIKLNSIGKNQFNYKNKISKFKFNDINDLINNIKSNTISEANAKRRNYAINNTINELNKITEI